MMSFRAMCLCLLIGVMLSCERDRMPVTDDPPIREVRALEGAGVENLFEIAPGVYSGGQPQGDAGFDTLQRLGIKTLVNVDGAQPDTDRAALRGMKTIHLPIGYDGIEPQVALQIAKASRVTDGPVFIHCHHGKHRGPTAAAVWCITTFNWSNETAGAWLDKAGTSPNYKGLHAVARDFKQPTHNQLDAVPADFPDHADTPPMVKVMVDADYRMEHIKDIRAANYTTPSNHPDLDPAHEALLLAELYRELVRTDDAIAKGDDFLEMLKQAEANAWKLQKYLDAAVDAGEADYTRAAEALFIAVNNDCKSCHTVYRNP